MVKVKPVLELLPMVMGSKARKSGKAPIEFRITLSGKKTNYSIGRTVFPENWNEATKVVSEEEHDHKAINKKIQKVIVDLEAVYDKLFFTFDKVTPVMIKNAYKGEEVSEKDEEVQEEEVPPPTLIEIFDDFIVKFEKQVKSDDRSDGTLRQWRSTRKKVIEFLFNRANILDIEFSKITPMFGEFMYDYLTAEVEKPLKDPTAKKHIKKFKQILSIAVLQQIIPNNPISHFQCGGDTKEVIPLDDEQILAIVSKDFKIDRLQEVADAYIVQIFTGFAFQDLYDLRPENIKLVGLEKERWLCKHRGKTGAYEVVPLLPIVEEIIENIKTILSVLKEAHFYPYFLTLITMVI